MSGLVLMMALGVVACDKRSTAPEVCGQDGLAVSLEVWPTWGPGRGIASFVHLAQSGSDSTYVATVDTSTKDVTPVVRLPGAIRGLAACEQGDAIAVSIDGEIYRIRPVDRSIVPITSDGRSASWPEWSADGSRLSYVQFLRRANEPDSLGGVRIVDMTSGTEQALMRTATRPWFAHGPATWSPDGTKLALFDADSTVGGRTRLVIVPVGGGTGHTVAWLDGVAERASWADTHTLYFDLGLGACGTDQTRKRTWRADLGSDAVGESGVQLGDVRVQFGYLFRLDDRGVESIHVGLRGVFGRIVATEVGTGTTELVTP